MTIRPCVALACGSVLLTLIAVPARAQTAAFHLHKEASSTPAALQLKTANPDAARTTIQSADLKNQPTGEYVIKTFDTQAGVPGLTGAVAGGSTILFSIWMRATANFGAALPRVRLRINNASGALLCEATGDSALTTTLTAYSVSCSIGADVVLAASDRLYLWVGLNVTAGPRNHSVKGELGIEGALNGQYDSKFTLPLPIAPPAVTALNPAAAPIGARITLTGTHFGATQGSSNVRFNGAPASVAAWSDSSITTSVPATATSGPVDVVVHSVTSNAMPFVVVRDGDVAGRVTRANNGGPVEGALVEISRAGTMAISTTTNAAGQYAMSQVAEGAYDLRVSANGLVTSMRPNVLVSAGTTTIVDVSLESVERRVTYVYDLLNRLVGVTDPNGDTATYKYDATGNVLSINRLGPSELSIIAFTPTMGPPGTTVLISGTNFSSGLAENSVRFNGVAGQVTGATPTQLVATVPAGSATGAISVVTPAASTTSSLPFTVTVNDGRPTITGLTPPVGVPASIFTISGTNFDPALSNNLVKLNGKSAALIGGDTGAITLVVPDRTMGGRIVLATPSGTATNAPDFVVAPAPHVASDVVAAGRISVGDRQTVTVATSGKMAVILFDGIAGEQVSVFGTATTLSGGCWWGLTLVAPDATTLGSHAVCGTANLLEPIVLPVAGTYSVAVDLGINGANTGTIDLTVADVVDVTGPIWAGGPTVPVSIAVPGQNAALTFSGNAGEIVSAVASNSTFPAGCTWTISIMKPDGSTLASGGSCGGDAFIDAVTLPVTGAYTLRVDPSGAATGNVIVGLYAVAHVTGPITPDGTAVPVAITTPGQNAALSFAGTAGDVVSAVASNPTFPGGCFWTISVVKPDGSTLGSGGSCGGNAFIDAVTLPVSGIYTLRLDIANNATGTVTLALFHVIDATGPIVAGGPSVPISISTPGQNALFTFAGTAGQVITASAFSGTFSGGCPNFILYILYPDGTSLAANGSCGDNASVPNKALPLSGTYTLKIDPSGANTGSVVLKLTSP